MGSFHQTCAVSHMPIVAGDPVVGFVLCKSYAYVSGSVDGYTGSGSVWQAISLPFAGRYNDYGFAEDIDRRFAADSLNASCGASFDDIVKAAESADGVETKMPHPFGPSKLMVMFVHEPVWAKLCARTVTPFGREIDRASEAARIDEFLEVMARVSAAKAARFKIPADALREFDGFRTSDEEWTEATGRPWTDCPYASNFFVPRKTEGVHSMLGEGVTRLVNGLHAAGDKDALRALLDDCIRTAIFDENMGKLRRLWTPQCGLGGDQADYELHAEIAEWAAGVCREKIAEVEYENVDGGDEMDGAAPAP